MKDHLRSLLKYCQLVNLEYINFIEKNKLPAKATALMSHIITAHHNWISRILNEKPRYAVWQESFESPLFEIDKGNYIASITIIDKFNPDDVITYNNTAGETYQNTIKEIFTHVVNHSSYHRGQISSLIVQSGLKPPITDYIVLAREGKLKHH
jgi:uncharacterized damage-inducible protein DinB